MNTLPLESRRILVTRPAGQQGELIEAIEALGGEALSLPLFAIKPIRNAHGAELRLGRSLLRLHDRDIVIFVSTNAARFGAQQLRERCAAIPPQALLLAVGAATAREAERLFGRRVDAPVAGSGSEALLESLQQTGQLAHMRDRKVTIFRGAGGRELLAEELQRRGAEVDYCEVYCRMAVPGTAGRLRAIWDSERPDAAVITSAGALWRWRQLLDELAGDAEASLASGSTTAPDQAGRVKNEQIALPLVVPSRRVAEFAAQQCGLTEVVNAGDAGARALAEALAALMDQRSAGRPT